MASEWIVEEFPNMYIIHVEKFFYNLLWKTKNQLRTKKHFVETEADQNMLPQKLLPKLILT